MKFRCGKCDMTETIAFDKIKKASEEFITIACGNCGVLNRLPNSLPTRNTAVKQEELNPTIVLSKPVPSCFEENVSIVPGWIFVHDEYTQKQSFDLKIGKNIIGRKSSVPVEIPIDTNDEYMSRRHCIIEVRPNKKDGYDFMLSDFKALNGTFINGMSKKRLKAEDIILLNDGDTLQLGMTKVVIRTNNSDISKNLAQSEVYNSSYAPTIVVAKK